MTYNFKTLAIVIFSLLSHTLYAHSTVIKGKVLDQSGSPLPGASVTVDDIKGTVTDVFGYYELTVEPGTKEVKVSYVGFETMVKSVDILRNEHLEIDFRLTPGDVRLADIVVSAEESETVKSISNYDIQIRPINTSQDVLRIVPGLFIAQHAGGGKAEQIFLRGFDIDHGTDITLTVDGMPVNMVSHSHGQGYSDLHFVIPETIESVDFSKGPYKASAGDFSTAGNVAFNTKKRLDKSMFKLEGGQFGTFRTVGMFNLLDGSENQNRPSAWMAGEFFVSDGFFESDQNFSRINVQGNYDHVIGSDLRVTASVSHFDSKWDASGQIPDRAVRSGAISRFGAIDDTEGGETSRTNVNFIVTKNLTDGGSFKNQFFYSQYDFNLVSNFTFFLEDPVNGDQITQSENRSIFGYNGTYAKNFNLGSSIADTEFGVSWRYDNIDDVRLSRTLNRRTILEDLAFGDVDQINLSAYASQDFDFGERLAVNAVLRYDYFDFSYVDNLQTTFDRQNVTKGVFSPKLSATYQLRPSMSIYGKAGIGFHSNDARVVVAQGGEEILPQAYGADLGTIWKPVDNLILDVGVWILDLEQEFVFVGDAGIVEPGGRTRRRGIDVSARYQLVSWLYADFDLNVTDPRALDESEGQDNIPLAPTFTTIGGLSFNFTNGINGSLRYRHISDRPANEDNSVVAEGYFLLDARLNYSKPKFALSLSVENLLDSEWNEAQFDTESRLFNEAEPVSEIHFTPGTPFFLKAGISLFF
ncbi:MAG: TonB-dependent receptor [Bacteroidota bacterium]